LSWRIRCRRGRGEPFLSSRLVIRYFYGYIIVMKQANIRTIENYLMSLPDSAAEQVVAFVSYLNYMQNLDCAFPYPDEQKVIDKYRKDPDAVMDWEAVKAII